MLAADDDAAIRAFGGALVGRFSPELKLGHYRKTPTFASLISLRFKTAFLQKAVLNQITPRFREEARLLVSSQAFSRATRCAAGYPRTAPIDLFNPSRAVTGSELSSLGNR